MEKGKHGSQLVLDIVVAVLIVLCGTALIFLKIENRLPALSVTNGGNAVPDAGIEEEYLAVEGRTAEAEIGDFEVKRNGSNAADDVTPEENMQEEENIEDYICSYSSERQITEEDIWELRSRTYEAFPEGKDVIQMVVNEMYARYGYQFNNKDIQAYFEKKQWYQDITERNSDMDMVYQNMTEIEKANIDFLSDYRGE